MFTNKKHTIEIVVVFLLAFSSLKCTYHSSDYEDNFNIIKGIHNNISLINSIKIPLDSEGIFISNIQNVTINDSTIMIAILNPNKVLIFDIRGNYKGTLGDSDYYLPYITPYVIRYYNNEFILYDFTERLFISFNKSLNISREYNYDTQNILIDFTFSDNYLIKYMRTGKGTPFISIYDRHQKELIKQLGSYGNRQDILNRGSGNQQVAIRNDTVYWIKSDEPVIYIYDIAGSIVDSLQIEDKYFNTGPLEFNHHRPEYFSKVIDYLLNNSRVKTIFTLDSYLIIEIENGHFMDESRTSTLHIYDYSFKYIDTVELDYHKREKYGLKDGIMHNFIFWAGHKGNTVYLITKSNDNIYILSGWSILTD